MEHGHNDIFCRRDQVHSATHSLDHFPWNLPVGDISILRYLHSPENCQVHMLSANHSKTHSRIKEGSPGKCSNGLFSRIYQIRIFFPFKWEGTHSQDSVFALELHAYIMPHKVGHQSRNSDSEVYVIPILYFFCYTLCYLFFFTSLFFLPSFYPCIICLQNIH